MMIHNPRQVLDNETYRQQAHARLDGLIEQAEAELLTGMVEIIADFQRGKITVIRRILNATDKTIAID